MSLMKFCALFSGMRPLLAVFGVIVGTALAFGIAHTHQHTQSQTSPPLSNETRPLIVATTGQVGDLLHNIVGKSADVKTLLGPGMDPHLHRLTRSETALLTRADIIVTNGFQLEAQMSRALKQLQESGHIVIEIGLMLPLEQRIKAADLPIDKEGHATVWDPHIWLDAGNWASIAVELGDQLAKHLPKQNPKQNPKINLEIKQRAAEFAQKLRKLDADLNHAFSHIPDRHRVLITSHDAFQYFGRAYDLEVLGIQGLSTESEAGLKAIENFVDRISFEKTPAVFTETTVSSRNVEAIIKGVAARGHQVNLGGTLYSDALGPVGSGAETYIGMMRHNAYIIAEALGAPSEALAALKPNAQAVAGDKPQA